LLLGHWREEKERVKKKMSYMGSRDGVSGDLLLSFGVEVPAGEEDVRY
jgi:hypothetical protein